MTKALEIPHLTYCENIVMDPLIEIKRSMQDLMPEGIKLTMMPFFIKALSIAIADYPIVNCSLAEDLASYVVHK